MNWMQFVSSLVGSLAWPGAVVTVVLVLKKAIVARVPALLKLTFPGGFSAEFAEEVKKLTAVEASGGLSITEESDSVVPHGVVGADEPPRVVLPTADNPDASDEEALQANPTGVVMEAWKSLERTLRDAAHHAAPMSTTTRRLGILQLLNVLFLQHFLSDSELEVLRKALELRNRAAHSEKPITAESASEFKALASSLDDRFRERIELLK